MHVLLHKGKEEDLFIDGSKSILERKTTHYRGT